MLVYPIRCRVQASWDSVPQAKRSQRKEAMSITLMASFHTIKKTNLHEVACQFMVLSGRWLMDAS